MRNLILVFTLSVVMAVHADSKLKLVYTNIGIGTWTTLNPDVKNSYLTSLKPDLYFKAGSFSWSIGIPVQYSIETIPTQSESKTSFGAVDLRTDIGWRFGPIEPTIGLVLPTGYNPNDNSNAWVGSGNRKFTAGLNFALGKYENRVRGGGAVGFSTTINGIDDGATFDNGVVTFSASVKGTVRLNEYWESGVDFYVTHSNYGENWEKVQNGWEDGMRPLSIVPAISLRRKLTSSLDIALRAGRGVSFDPSDSDKKVTQVLVAGFSVSMY